MTLGAERIAHLRTALALNAVEEGIVQEARRRKPRIIVFRGVNSARERVWQLAPDLDEAQLAEAGYVLSRALLPLHRHLVAAGVIMMVHAEWTMRDCTSVRHGVARLHRERGSEQTPLADLDQWLLRNMLLHVALPLDHVMQELLPMHLAMINRRIPRVEQLVANTAPAGLS